MTMKPIKILQFTGRNAEKFDINNLLALERVWPENQRATKEILLQRLEIFQDGFFIAEDNSGILATIICYPYNYDPRNLSNYNNWNSVINKCYSNCPNTSTTNALYIASGTSKPNKFQSILFELGINHVINLGKQLQKKYIVGGSLLPGYSRYIEKNEHILANEYVSTKQNNKFVDPLIEKYRKLGFKVPDKNHVIPDYFPCESSLNYSALVVKEI